MGWLGEISSALNAVAALVAGLAGTAFTWLHRPETAIILAGMLFVGALACSAWFLVVRIRPVQSALHAVLMQIETTADKVSFAAIFPSIDMLMKDIVILRRPWVHFTSRLQIAPKTSRQPIRYSGGAGDVSIRDLAAGRLPDRDFRVWPNYFLAAGLLLCALGIISQFYFGNQLVAEGPPPRPTAGGIMLALLPLMSGAISWLVLTAVGTTSANALCGTLDALTFALEDRLEFEAVPSGLTMRGRELERARAPDQVEEQIRTLARDIGGSLRRVETQLSDTLPGRIGEAMGPLAAAVEQLGNRLSDSNGEALREVVSELAAGMHERTAREGEAMAGMLAEARAGLEAAGAAIRETRTAVEGSSVAVSDTMNAATGQLRDEVAGAGGQLRDDLQTAGDALASNLSSVSEDVARAFGPLSEQISALGEMLETVNTRMGQQGEAFASVVEWAQSAAKSMGEAATNLVHTGPASAALDPFVTENLSRAAGEARASMRDLTEARQMLARLAENLRQPVTALLSQDWENYREMFAETDDPLTEIFENFRNSANSQRVGLDTAIGTLDARLDRALRDIEAGTVRLDVAIGGIGGADVPEHEPEQEPKIEQDGSAA